MHSIKPRTEKLLKNHVDLKTTFEANGWLSSNKKSTGQLFKEWHYDPSKAKNLGKNDILNRLKIVKTVKFSLSCRNF